MKAEISIIEQHCGDVITILEPCYLIYDVAEKIADKLNKEVISKGYKDIKYIVRDLEIIGLN